MGHEANDTLNIAEEKDQWTWRQNNRNYPKWTRRKST